MTALRRTVLPFDGGRDETMQPHVRGGKGLSLAEMTALGLRVPPGFTLAAGVSRAYNQEGRLPKRVLGQVERETKMLEKTAGRMLGEQNGPLLVSVRSGAELSMPGMMDTILNVGLTTPVLDELEREHGSTFAVDVAERFRQQWRDLIGAEVPRDPFDQILHAVEAVLRSWNSARAVAYRKRHGIPNGMGTAVTVQQMVFGNIDQHSCTGVVFSADPISGEDGLYGEFLVQAQGEDVVAGISRTRPIDQLGEWDEVIASELKDVVQRLEAHFAYPVDVEFTVECGTLYVLQARAVKFSPQARIIRAVRKVEMARPRSRREDVKQEVLKEIPASLVDAVLRPKLPFDAADQGKLVTSGIAASPGAVVGIVACDIETAQRRAAEGMIVVLVRPDTAPSDLPGMLASKAIVTGAGGPTCHAAIVARDLGIPAVVGVSNSRTLRDGALVTVDGDSGRVFAGALELTTPSLAREVQLLQKWQLRRRAPRVGLEFVTEQVSSAALLADLYMTDMMANATRGTSREMESIRLRDETHVAIAERLAVYLLLAIAAEARHFWRKVHSSLGCEESATYVNNQLDAKYASSFGIDKARSVTQARALRLADTAPDDVVVLVEHIHTLFAKASWMDGYGGSKWAAIANCLLRFLKEEISHTVFADQVFDLRHNGGYLFDKHKMIEEVSGIKDLLDLKKVDGSVSKLKSSCDFHGARLSQPVRKMWETGMRAGLW